MSIDKNFKKKKRIFHMIIIKFLSNFYFKFYILVCTEDKENIKTIFICPYKMQINNFKPN